MIYSKRLIDLKEEKNLKDYEIAQFLEIMPKTYSSYEEEFDIMSINTLNKLCSFFNVSCDYILFLTENRQYSNNKDIKEKLSAQRLKDFREENHLTQGKLAKFLNIDTSLISKWEHGKLLINTSFLYAICKKYKISADYLLGKIDYPKYLK